MGLTDILCRSQIVSELQATDRWEAIDELVGTLVAAGKIKAEERDCVTAVVKKRELSASTGFGFGVAFPTAPYDAIDTLLVAIGRSKKGIDFASLDKQPVTMIMLILVPTGQYLKYATFAQALVNHFYSQPFRLGVQNAANADEIYHLFGSLEKDLAPAGQS